MAGGVFTGANPGFNARELAYQLRDSEASLLLCTAASLEIGLNAVAQVGMSKDKIFIFDDDVEAQAGGQARQDCRHWTTLLASVEDGQRFTWKHCNTAAESNETIALNYSSGTTGFPKGVEITHKNYVANTLQQRTTLPVVSGEERWLCFLPLYHAMAQTAYTVAAPSLNIPVYVMPKFDFVAMLDCVQKFKITYLFLVPPILVAMAKHPDVRAGGWDLSSVKATGSGAAPLGKEIRGQFVELWGGNMRVGQGWGMTE